MFGNRPTSCGWGFSVDLRYFVNPDFNRNAISLPEMAVSHIETTDISIVKKPTGFVSQI
jgi:hypothetical protein